MIILIEQLVISILYGQKVFNIRKKISLQFFKEFDTFGFERSKKPRQHFLSKFSVENDAFYIIRKPIRVRVFSKQTNVFLMIVFNIFSQ